MLKRENGFQTGKEERWRKKSENAGLRRTLGCDVKLGSGESEEKTVGQIRRVMEAIRGQEGALGSGAPAVDFFVRKMMVDVMKSRETR